MSDHRLFHLVRDVDPTGVSGMGTVADGVVWPDGTVTVRWRGSRPSIVQWFSLDDAMAVHGHDGSTRVEWADRQRPALPRRPSVLDDDQPITDLADLARALGGEPSSWTGEALKLIAKSDADHRAYLIAGIGELVNAHAVWMTMTDTSASGPPPARQYLAVLDVVLAHVRGDNV